MWRLEERIPFCIVDKVITPPLETASSRDNTMPYKRMLRWLLENSTCLISCLYQELYERESRLFDCAKNRPALRVIDISQPETVRSIEEYIQRIPDRERFVYQSVAAGWTFKDLAGLLRVSPPRVQQILESGCRKIREHLRWQYRKAQFSGKGRRNQSCGIFSVGELSQEILSNFEGIIDFLISVYDVRGFYIEAPYVRSALVKAIQRGSNPYQELRITAITDGRAQQGSDTELEDIGASFCPPCHTTMCVGRADDSVSKSMGIIPDIIDTACFCLCSFSEVPDIAGLRRHISRGTVLLDLGRAGVIPEL